MNAGMRGVTAETVKQQFDISLERTGAGYFDYYLLHALGRGNISNYDNFGIWDYVKEKKAQGLIKHYGFSFHSDPAHLEELLTKHPDVDFIQLQINYADWNNPGVASRECYEIARKHGVSITVMEPVKGGALANPIPGVQKIFKEADPNASFASWAIRYVASMDGIITVLSGMSNIDQMNDNLSYMRNFKPLSAEEQEVIRRVQAELTKDHSIKCTACHYCTEGCPMNIPIPEIFGVKNRVATDPGWDQGKGAYRIATEGKGKASACIGCGQCEHVCPQHLPIIELLKGCTSLE
jgi:predicted aldo/keto reductase-like oxidoreductase